MLGAFCVYVHISKSSISMYFFATPELLLLTINSTVYPTGNPHRVYMYVHERLMTHITSTKPTTPSSSMAWVGYTMLVDHTTIYLPVVQHSS